MKKLMLFAEIVIIFLILQSLLFTRNYLVGTPILFVYIAFKLYTSKAAILAFRGNRAFKQKNYRKALSCYESSCKSFNCDDSIKIRYAYIALYSGDLQRCKDILDIIPSNHLKEPLSTSFKVTTALLTWKIGNLEKAISICKKAGEEYEHTLIYETLGYLLLLSKRYQEALAYNKKAYEFDKSSTVIIDNLAQSYYFLGYYDKANNIYSSLLSNSDKTLSFSEPYYYYGLILNKLGDKSGCINYLKEALNKNESFLSDLTHQKIRDTLATL